MDKRRKRIPLKERLRNDGQGTAAPLKVFFLYTDDYMIALSEMAGELSFADHYEQVIKKEEDGRVRLLSEYIGYVRTLPKDGQDRLLYPLLVAPAVKLNSMERGKLDE